MQGEAKPKESLPSSMDLRRLLDLFYPVPDPLSSDEERRRFFHEDLWDLTAEELKVERARVFWVLTFQSPSHPWLLERLDAIDARSSNVA